ncbi:hypothetical protein niasHT_016429 [Heterodera trifolii]|uniref:ATPase AAA-type core domain-containing protein n=1 Tax=Heterodera trifolii TaxID=157864 RepID=A0ABD2LJ24_9BILA
MPQSLDIEAFSSVFPAEPAYTYKDLFEERLNEKSLPDIVEQLEEHVSLLREPGRHVWCQLPKALVLHGLSGIGKTHIAKTIARKANCRFVEMVAMSENLLLHSSSCREMTVTFDARDSIVRGLAAHEIGHAVVAVLDRDATPLQYAAGFYNENGLQHKARWMDDEEENRWATEDAWFTAPPRRTGPKKTKPRGTVEGRERSRCPMI